MIQCMEQGISLKSERNNPWFKPRFNILLHTQSIVCVTVDSQCFLEYLGCIIWNIFLEIWKMNSTFWKKSHLGTYNWKIWKLICSLKIFPFGHGSKVEIQQWKAIFGPFQNFLDMSKIVLDLQKNRTKVATKSRNSLIATPSEGCRGSLVFHDGWTVNDPFRL